MSPYAIAFDAYGTLFDVHSVTATLSEVLPERADEVSHLWRRKQLEYTWLRALMGRYRDFEAVTRDALEYALAGLALDLVEADRIRLMDGYRRLEAYPEVGEALASLATLKRCILSNGSPDMLAAAVAHAGIGEHLDAVLSVDTLRTFKPDPRVYRLACDHFELEAGDIAFATSNAWDVAGAGAFGFFTCWVNRSGAPPELLGVEADVTVRNLSDLAEALNVGRAR